MDGIYFPGMGISLPNVPDGISIFGFNIKFYGLIIAIGFVLALIIATREGRHTGMGEDDYLDYWLWMIIPTILGARIYYILFNLKEYVGEGISFGESLRRMIDIRNGGLGIYGGIIAGVIVSYIYTKKKKIYLPQFADNITYGILIGQILGRWGNFFNREVFGEYTSGFLRMGLPLDYFKSHGTLGHYQSSGIITDTMLQNTEMINGQECITVMPSFLLEGLWNLALLIFIFLYRKRKKFDGELSMIYIMGYGIGRFIIEGNRTDSLMIGPLKVSQVVAIMCIVTGLAVLIRNYVRLHKGIAVTLHPWKKELPYYDNPSDEDTEDDGEDAADDGEENPDPDVETQNETDGTSEPDAGIPAETTEDSDVGDDVEESGGKSDQIDGN